MECRVHLGKQTPPENMHIFKNIFLCSIYLINMEVQHFLICYYYQTVVLYQFKKTQNILAFGQAAL